MVRNMNDMNSLYSVSVIIPVHNTAPYLERCVESVRNQTLKNIEIILVENKSQDNSPVLCDEYARRDPRIKVLHLSIAGLSIARNAGLKIASAPYVGFIDSDDYISETMFQDLLDAISSSQAEMAYCNFCYEYEDGKIETVYTDSGHTCIRQPKEVIEDIICEKVSSSSCTKLFKKELFASLLFPEGVFFEDHAVLYKWVAMCTKVVWVDKVYYYYYQRDGSICHTLDMNKHYHFFMAEYPRLDFVKEKRLFSEKERGAIIKMIAQTCFYHFSDFMQEAKFLRDRKQIKDMRNSLTVGDEIITIGGLCGKIVKTKDETIVVQAGADKVKFEMMRWAVSTVTKESTKRGMQDNFEDDDEPKKVMPKKLRKSSDIEEAEAKEPETKEAKVFDEE